MNKCLVIAEAGVNHNGSLSTAKKLIDAAAAAGVDIVKFQSFKADMIVTKSATKAQYQKTTTGSSENQLDMLRRLELTEKDHDDLIDYCRIKKIEFLSTPFDLDSIELLKSKGIRIGKIPSGEVTNLPYLRAMARAFPTIILSTGMCKLQEVRDALTVLLDSGAERRNITVLHCNTEYPTPMQDVNLRAMEHMGGELDISVGYSDHTLGIEVPIAAIALGATVIEKHFTLDRTMDGPDHRASLEPSELKAMVSAIRNIEMALSGSGIKEPSPSETKNIQAVRKSIFARKKIGIGEKFSAENLVVKRPGGGLSPMMWDKLIGKTSNFTFDEDDFIKV